MSIDFKRIEAAEVKLWDFSAYFWNAPRILISIYLNDLEKFLLQSRNNKIELLVLLYADDAVILAYTEQKT